MAFGIMFLICGALNLLLLSRNSILREITGIVQVVIGILILWHIGGPLLLVLHLLNMGLCLILVYKDIKNLTQK